MNPYPFFEALAADNTREFFSVHRSEYDAIRAEWVDGMERVHALLAPHWDEVRYAAPRTFRIYRDVRFSYDKRPFKTHIGSTIAPAGQTNVHAVGVYVECGIPDADSGVFGGIWAPDTKTLTKLRHAIVDNIEEWEEIVTAPELTRLFPEWFGERLKTAPKGWPKNHPQIEYLRLKHIGRVSTLTRRQFMSKNWPDLIAERAIAIVPMLRFLDYSLREEL